MSARRPQYVDSPYQLARTRQWRLWRCQSLLNLRGPKKLPRDEWLTFDQLNRFNQQVLIDTTPLPEDVPAVKEIGASSAPLLSASFFIGARCRDYNDDYMQCKTESANGRGEFDCMKEGRRVTRCAQSVYVYYAYFRYLDRSGQRTSRPSGRIHLSLVLPDDLPKG